MHRTALHFARLQTIKNREYKLMIALIYDYYKRYSIIQLLSE